jgi:Cu(I)/Ag(I) efflux system membrane protein CusA/SilA
MNSNIMSLGGMAIAIGAMVDAAIVMIENAHKHIERLKDGHTDAERAEAMHCRGRKKSAPRCSSRC